MIVHIDNLYYERLQPDEYRRITNSIFEFRWQTRHSIGLQDKTSLLWKIGVNSDGDEVDCLSLQFVVSGRNPEEVEFPILSTRDITGASLYARYIRAKATVKEKI